MQNAISSYQSPRMPDFRERIWRLPALQLTLQVAFFLFLFFVVFGKTLPFREKITDPDSIAASNPINQFVFGPVYLLAALALAFRWQRAWDVIRKEKFLTLFLLWALLSVTWSGFPFTSLKRWIQEVGVVMVALAVFLYSDSSEQAFRKFRYIFYLYIPLSLFSVFLIAGAIDPSTQTWRGLAATKNNLGEIALISSLLFAYYFFRCRGRKKLIPLLYLLSSIVLLIGSRSLTSLLAFGICLLVGLLLALSRSLGPTSVSRFFGAVAVGSLAAIGIGIVFWMPEIYQSFFNLLGKDTTFTDRIFLWDTVWNEIQSHPLIGSGFSGFWVADWRNVPLMVLYEDFVWLPNQAHMGYLDLINETGVIGLGIFLMLIGHYAATLLRWKSAHYWKWMFFAILIVNFQETTLFRQTFFLSVVFIFSYLALFVEANRPSGSPAG